MSIEVEHLYNEIYKKYGAVLLTGSFYGSEAGWAHDLENIDYTIYLHGDELVFNVSMNSFTDKERKEAITKLIARRSAGLIMSTEDDRKPSKELVSFCDEKHFPLMWVNYNAPFIDMLHESFDLLVYEDRNSRTREEAFKNAVKYSGEPDKYLSLMETDSFFSQGKYTVLIAAAEDRNGDIQKISEMFAGHISRNVTFTEGNTLVVLLTGYTTQEIRSDVQHMMDGNAGMTIAIGETVESPREISSSYDKAKMAFCMMPALRQRAMAYSDLGIYKLLYSIRDSSSADEFIEETLGKLIKHDKKNRSDYMAVLESFIANECLVTQTADDMFFHRNTIKYKLSAIRDILGYDIMLNENRFRIMMAFYLMRIRKNI